MSRDAGLEGFVKEQLEVIYTMFDTVNQRVDGVGERVEALEGKLREETTALDKWVDKVSMRVDDLKETLGGAEAEIQRLHHRIGVEEQRTSRSITDWAAAGCPGLVRERDEARRELVKAQDRILDVMAQRDAYESALEAARDLITDRL